MDREHHQEHEPTYLQDVAMPQEEERASEDFDLDAEFGRETTRRIEETLRSVIEDELGIEQFHDFAGENAACYLTLFGQRFWSEDQEAEMENALREKGEEELARGNFGDAAWESAPWYHMLTGKRFWDADTEQHMLQGLKRRIEQFIQEKQYSLAVLRAFRYRSLGGKCFWDEKAQAGMVNAAKASLRHWLTNWSGHHFEMYDAAYLRILCAHELRFTDQGIEIIDAPSSAFQQKTHSLPEERVF